VLQDAGRDYAINYLLKMYNVSYGLVIYNTIMFNPIEIAISILALKLGVNKLVLGMIIAFLI
jgi:hypothetical protein